MNFEKMAREHWTKYLPEMTRGLKKAGMFEQEVKTAARYATEELTALVRNGAQISAATEIVLNEYIFLPPETTE